MKQLLLYVNPKKEFDEETAKLAKIQIENSLGLGWKPEDILFFTNFPYSFMGIESTIVPDECYNNLHPQTTKIDTMVYLFDNGFIQDDLYWLHDFDAVQQEWITEEELELDGIDIGFTDYGRNDRYNGGSVFVRKEAVDIYRELKDQVYEQNKGNTGKVLNEEDVLMYLMKIDFNGMKQRIKRLSIGYNFGIKQMKLCYEKANGMIKVLHFHPERKYPGWGRAFDIVSTENNELEKPIMTERLISLFEKYGITRTR